ncbi:hypothetical protein, partial [Streptomyces sp. x-80]|uniref:hypothetical protein n=1 Tax=Streptomyces sp. x-80 TaxID=2789282 RepID=UPI0039814D27
RHILDNQRRQSRKHHSHKLVDIPHEMSTTHVTLRSHRLRNRAVKLTHHAVTPNAGRGLADIVAEALTGEDIELTQQFATAATHHYRAAFECRSRVAATHSGWVVTVRVGPYIERASHSQKSPVLC